MNYDYVGLSQDAKLYRQVQKLRLGIGERIRSKEQGRSQRNTERDEAWYEGLFAVEKSIKKSVELAVTPHPLWIDWLSEVRGVGKLGLAQLLGEIGPVNMTHNRIVTKSLKTKQDQDWIKARGNEIKPTGIGAFRTVSSLWHFAGLKPGLKRIKGERASYNGRLKAICLEHIGSSMLRANGAYRRVYDDRRAYTAATRDPKDWPPLRMHYDARRVMVKLFLSHFWEKWRLIEGYPIRLPYVIEKLGHSHLYPAEDFLGNEPVPIPEEQSEG